MRARVRRGDAGSFLTSVPREALQVDLDLDPDPEMLVFAGSPAPRVRQSRCYTHPSVIVLSERARLELRPRKEEGA